MKHKEKGGSREGNRRLDEIKSFVEVVTEGKNVCVQSNPNHLLFYSNSDVRDRWSKAFVGEVVHPGESFNIQNHFEMEGAFSIKIVPLGEIFV